MATLMLPEDEVDLLRTTLDTALTELDDQIAHTDARAFRERLAHRRARLRHVRDVVADAEAYAAMPPEPSS